MIILGGPRHGHRITLAHGNFPRNGIVRMAEPRDPKSWHKSFHIPYGVDPLGLDLAIREVEYPIVTMPPRQSICAAVHPDITEDTGRRLLSDLVAAAWERAA